MPQPFDNDPRSPELQRLIVVHGGVKKVAADDAACCMILETLFMLEIAGRALGWRWSVSTGPDHIFRVNVTTADGREIASTHTSWIACILDPDFAYPIETAYYDAIKARVAEG